MTDKELLCFFFSNKNVSIKHFKTLSELNIAALLTVEIGGCNSMEPLILGAELDLPTLDCDTMGKKIWCYSFMIPFINLVFFSPLNPHLTFWMRAL